MKEIHLVRHGQTDYNKKGIVQGRGLNASINQEGIEQANAFYEHYKNENYCAVYTSTLIRTHQTVAPFLENGYKNKHTILSGLDEFNWGIFEGQEFETFLDSYNYLLNQWGNGFLNEKPEKGESPFEVAARQQEALHHIYQQSKEQKVLICMHGRALRLILCQLLGVPMSQMDTFKHSNTSLYVIQMTDQGNKLLVKNSLEHLALIKVG